MSAADNNVVFSNNGFEIHYVADDNRIYLNAPNNGQRLEVTPDLVHHLSEVILEKNIPYGEDGAAEETEKKPSPLANLPKPALILGATLAFAAVGVAATLLTLWGLKQRKPKTLWSRFSMPKMTKKMPRMAMHVDWHKMAQPLDRMKDWEIPDTLVRWKRG